MILHLLISHTRQGRWATGYSWVLHLVISPTQQQGYDLLRAGSASGYHTRYRGAIYYGYWVLVFVKSGTRQVVRRALGSESLHIMYEPAKGTILYGHEVLHFVNSHTRHGVRVVTGIVLCILRYHTRNRGYDLLRASGSGSCDNTHTRQEITLGCGHWV